jgi:predicted ATPase
MSRIKIKNFGPIREGCLENDGWLDIKKVTVFTGNQGSGKSTLAKAFSTLTWLEKKINRGDFIGWEFHREAFHDFFQYHRIHNYFREDTEIEYEGKVNIKYNKDSWHPYIYTKASEDYKVPKIMYVPAERNFLSVVKNAYGIKNLPDALYTFAEELRKVQLGLDDDLLNLPVGDIQFRYKRENETSYLVGNNYELDLTESSSGYQSLVPLYLVTKFLSDELQKEKTVLREQLSVEQSVRRNKEISDIMFNPRFSDEEKNRRVKEVDARYLNTCFVNIVEEPEQNLFPQSQQKMLYSLTGFNNRAAASKLVITTHSPYLINYLTLAVKAFTLREEANSEQLNAKIEKIVPLGSEVAPDDLAIYELDEKTGTVKSLEHNHGLPSDENKLNELLGESNEMFAQLLEIEQGL